MDKINLQKSDIIGLMKESAFFQEAIEVNFFRTNGEYEYAITYFMYPNEPHIIYMNTGLFSTYLRDLIRETRNYDVACLTFRKDLSCSFLVPQKNLILMRQK